MNNWIPVQQEEIKYRSAFALTYWKEIVGSSCSDLMYITYTRVYYTTPFGLCSIYAGVSEFDTLNMLCTCIYRHNENFTMVSITFTISPCKSHLQKPKKYQNINLFKIN